MIFAYLCVCKSKEKYDLKLVSTIFYQIFIFSSNDRPSKTLKIFSFHLKSSFRSRDIQVFPFLSTLSRFKKANGSGIIDDVINFHKFAEAIFRITQKPLHYIIKLGQIIHN